MQTYIPRSLVDGYRLGAQNGGMVFVAVPKQKAIKGCFVSFQGRGMKIEANQKPVQQKDFSDKWGRGTYTLYYYIWEQKTQMPSNYIEVHKSDKKPDGQLDLF